MRLELQTNIYVWHKNIHLDIMSLVSLRSKKEKKYIDLLRHSNKYYIEHV